MFILIIVDLLSEKNHNTAEARPIGIGKSTEVLSKLRDFKQEEQQFAKDGCKCVLLSSTWIALVLLRLLVGFSTHEKCERLDL